MSNDPNIAPPGKNPGSQTPRRRTVGMYDRPEKQGLSLNLITALVLIVLIAIALSIFLLTR